MTANVDPFRLQCYAEILSRPDPAHMHRAYRVTQPGREDRRQAVFLKLIVAWASRHWLERDGESQSWSTVQRPNRVQMGRFL